MKEDSPVSEERLELLREFLTWAHVMPPHVDFRRDVDELVEHARKEGTPIAAFDGLKPGQATKLKERWADFSQGAHCASRNARIASMRSSSRRT